MEKDKALTSAQAGIDAIREDENINGSFRACLPDVFGGLQRSREAAADIRTFEDCGLRIQEVPQEDDSEVTGRYVAHGMTIRRGSEVVGRMVSNSMAKRAARALNLQSHKI